VSRSSPGSGAEFVSLDVPGGIWERVFVPAPLVVVGTREGEGYDLAPKHLALPLGWSGRYGFVCTPRHATYRNARESGAFTVSYPTPDRIVYASLSATPREEGEKPVLEALPTVPAEVVDGILLADATLHLECEMERTIDDLDEDGASLVVGRIVAARARADAVRASDLDDAEVLGRAPALVYLHPGRFASIGETYAFPFPADFRG